MQKLLEVMRKLRGTNGCPWDREQTHESLAPYLLEEAAEAVDALGNPKELAGELGDVLLQVAFHSVIAEESGSFDYTEVENEIVSKLLRRHPHVFGDVQLNGSAEVLVSWNEIKKTESAEVRSLSGQIPSALGALAREAKAQALMHKAPIGRQEMLLELAAVQDTRGGVAHALALVTSWARGLGVDAETTLRSSTNARIKDSE